MIPDAIQADEGPLLSELQASGLRVTDSRYDAKVFGNYYVDLVGARGWLRVTRDRGQYLIGGDDDRPGKLGLFRAFDDMIEFRKAVLAYAREVT